MKFLEQDKLTLEIERQLNSSLILVDSEYNSLDLELQLREHKFEYSSELLTLHCVLRHLLFYLKRIEQQKWIVNRLSRTFTCIEIFHALFVIADKSCNDSNFFWKLDERAIVLERQLLRFFDYKVLIFI